MNSDESVEIKQIPVEPETKEIILNDTVTIHNELRKLTPLERIQILNQIIKEEEAEEILKNQKQEQLNKEQECAMSRNGCRMFGNTKAILIELHNLRLQMQNLQNEVKLLNRNQSNLNNQMSSCYKKDELSEYCSKYSDEGCGVLSFIIDWMPFWIFISFILFAFIGKPSRLCSVSSGLGSSSGVCPMTGLGGLCEFVTKL
jgi:hypothetical protein